MKVVITRTITVGHGKPLFFIAGPCVIESEALCLSIARSLRQMSARLKLPIVFKASFDKANRSSAVSFRGPGLERGLAILAKVKEATGLPILTDIHEPRQAARVAKVADIIQVPAFLARQTDLLFAAADTGAVVNVKKGQFMAPDEMGNVIAKLHSRGNRRILLTERGTTFGYHNLVVDMKGLAFMRALGVPVVFDATHSVQRPAGGGTVTSGDGPMVPVLSRAAAGAGVDGFFFEVHPRPARALSDAANTLPLSRFPVLARTLAAIDRLSGR